MKEDHYFCHNINRQTLEMKEANWGLGMDKNKGIKKTSKIWTCKSLKGKMKCHWVMTII